MAAAAVDVDDIAGSAEIVDAVGFVGTVGAAAAVAVAIRQQSIQSGAGAVSSVLIVSLNVNFVCCTFAS